MTRPKRPRDGRTIRRKQCPVCRQRLPFAIDENGDAVLQAHPDAGQERLPAADRTQCLGVGARASQA